MSIDFLLEVFEQHRAEAAIVWEGRTYDYGWLLRRISEWRARISEAAVSPGSVVVLEADFSPSAVALFLALTELGCVLVPLTSSVASKRDEFIEMAQGEVVFSIDREDRAEYRTTGYRANHEFYLRLREARHPGLVLFSSGSTGRSKGVVHDLAPLLDKFRVSRHALRTMTFLLFDHIGGINTMLYVLSNGGCMVTVQDRSPDGVLSAIERHRVELLPTSPTFINLLLLSEAHSRHDLSSLQKITYGTEPMQESTLKRLSELFPHIKLLQTYGLSEVGILRSQSRSSDSLWVRIGGEGFETRVVDGILQIKARSAMLGYLNAPSPYTDDGWFITGDLVETDGEFLRFLGRKSEVINVGGEKVYPAEIESVIQQIENVVQVSIYGEKNAITGSIVCADVVLNEPEDRKQFTSRLKQFCRERLQGFKVPVKVSVVDHDLHNERFKKMRRIDLDRTESVSAGAVIPERVPLT